KSFGPAEEARRWLEEKATVFPNTGKLLDDVELCAAENFVKSPEAMALGLSPLAHQLVMLSRQAIAQQKQQANRRAELERREAEAETLRKQVELRNGLVLLLQLVAQVHTQKEDNLDLALLLSLEANRIA